MMLIGGLLGFGTGLLAALARNCEWSSVLWRASIAAYMGGLLMKWWGRVWVDSLHQLQMQKVAEAAQAKQQQANTPNPKKN
jgi:hypothetical protein